MKNKKANAPAKPESPEEFRCKLVYSILNDEILTSFDDEKRELLLNRLSCAYTKPEPTHDQARFRTLEKVSANAERLKTAINELTLKDGETLDFRLKDQTPLSKIEIFLEALNKDSLKLANLIKGEHKKIKALQEELQAGSLINTLRQFEIPCKRRSDYEIPASQKVTSSTTESTNEISKFPNLNDRTTLAMRCTLLALLDGKQKRLSWPKTIAIIKRGIAFHKDKTPIQHPLLGTLTRADNESIKLFFIEYPVWNALKL